MGNFAKTNDIDISDAIRPKTALLILVLLRDATRPLTTYEIGLEISDDHVPPRPLSIIVKNLAKDGYISAVGKAGKRLSFWMITVRGSRSLRIRDHHTIIAETFLALAPSRNSAEVKVEHAITLGHLDPRAIARETGLKPSVIKTCMKRAAMRQNLRAVAD